MKKFLMIVISGLIFINVNAQEKWSLQKCIDYAQTNNIVIKQYEINTKYQENELQQSKNNRLPGVSANLSQDFSFGRSEQLDGTYRSRNTMNTSLSLGTNVVVYSGGRLKNTIVQQDYELKKSLENLKKAKDDVTLNITSGYLEILFAKEMIKVSEAQADATRLQIKRTEELVNAGKLAPGALLELQSQLASEELEIVNRQNALQIYLLNLTQVLELENYTNFDIVTPELPEMSAVTSVSSSSQVFDKAVENRPEIKSAEYQLKSSEIQLKIANSGLYPTVSASAGIGDNYFNMNDVENEGLGKQLLDNHGEYIGLGVNIPIFNKFQNKTNIENSKLQIENRRLELESAKKDLRKQIEQAYTNAVAAFKRYNSSMTAVNSMKESFRYVEEKFNAGRVNSVEYNDSKSRMSIAESQLIQAKYDFIFRTKILDFYNGIPIEL
ncbi:MAG: TolC family protein [Prolixibacteraceae bacterium]|nr:TolC family protein [Prolixibacteraceae bacterium]